MTSLTPDVCYAYPQQTAYAGTGLFASKGIPAGELVIRINDPLVSVPDSPHLTDTCSNCFAWVPKGQAGAEDEYLSVELKACTGCKIVRYCGKVGRHRVLMLRIFMYMFLVSVSVSSLSIIDESSSSCMCSRF